MNANHRHAPTLVVLTGPTAVGKTALALRVAACLSCDIISADSRQIYQGLPIGTAQPTAEERAAVPHHFVGTLSLDAYYSAAQYEADVLALLRRQFQDHDFALLTGGSMMYIDAVCHGIDTIPTISPDVREDLRRRLSTDGLDALVAELRRLDPDYCATADLRNPKRVVHALEVCRQTGGTFSSLRTGRRRECPFRTVKIGLRRDRTTLFARINSRVDAMMSAGLLDEARAALPYRHLNALNTVGYKELFNVLDGTWPLPMAVERIKKNTRVYAKKQLTWLARDADIHWLDLDTLTTAQAAERIVALAESEE